MKDILFSPYLWLGVGIGFLVSEMRPRECDKCGRSLTVLRDVEDLPPGTPAKYVTHAAELLEQGVELYVREFGNRLVVQAVDTGDKVLDLFEISKKPPPSIAPAAPAPTV